MKNKKIAIVHFALQSHVKGGGEIVDFAIRDHYDADFWVISWDDKVWNKEQENKDEFVKSLWSKPFKVLQKESKIPVWRKFKRLLTCKFVSKKTIKELEKYDTIIFSDDIPYIPRKLKNPKKIFYRHTNPFFLNPQEYAQTLPKIFQPLYKRLAKSEQKRYTKDLQSMDIIISNSQYSSRVLEEKTGIKSEVVYPPVDTSKFEFLEPKGYYLSFARLEEQKRIKLIVEAFEQLPDKKLVIAHTGELKDWVKNEIKIKNLDNIEYVGTMGKSNLTKLIGECVATIYIPKNEAAGISQIESMTAGKPVIGVSEGGLAETIINEKTGILIQPNPDKYELKSAIIELTPQKSLKMKNACIKQAKQFDTKTFFAKLDELVLD